MANIIVLEQTCSACPEQYWARKGGHIIGYIRLRWGHLSCEYLPTGYLKDYTVLLLEHTFVGDKYKGCFDSEQEREYWLNRCKRALLSEYVKHKCK